MLHEFWKRKEADQIADGKKALDEMRRNHESEERNTIKHLENTLPSKVKESAELLNLRKMEEHMSKQKLYVDAHQVKTRIAEMLRDETN